MVKNVVSTLQDIETPCMGEVRMPDEYGHLTFMAVDSSQRH